MTNRSQKSRPRTAICHFCIVSGREKKFKIRGFHARKLLKTLGAFLQFPIFSHDLRLRGEILSLRLCRAVQFVAVFLRGSVSLWPKIGKRRCSGCGALLDCEPMMLT